MSSNKFSNGSTLILTELHWWLVAGLGHSSAAIFSVNANLACRDLDSSGPFLAADHDPYRVFARGEGDVGGRVAEEFAVPVNLASLGDDE
jgi:hypothetical protein